jgi:single-strand selective monofunctional uracil DNA glycosylase
VPVRLPGRLAGGLTTCPRSSTCARLPLREATPLYAACDEALRATVALLEPKAVVGVGAFTEARAKEALPGLGLSFGRMLHPSPASPLANRDWPGEATKALQKLDLWPAS